MHGQAGQQLRQRQVFFGFQDARVRVFVEDAVGAGALSVQFVQASASARKR